MKKYCFLMLALLLMPTITFAEVITENRWDTFMSWGHTDKLDGVTGVPVGKAEAITCSSDPYCGSSPDSSKVLRVTYLKGLRSGQSPSITSYNLDVPELWVSYWFKYSSNYRWEPSQNKHFYLHHSVCQDASLCPGGLPPDTHNLLIFGIRGSRNRPAFSIPGGGATYYQPPELFPELSIQKNRWYKVKIWVHANTTGTWLGGHNYTGSNGGFKLWIDDVLIINQPTGVPLRRSSYFNSSNVIKEFSMEPVYGGATSGWYVLEDQYLYFSNTILSTTSIDGVSKYDPSKIPFPPEKLSIGK